jgi:hypothetical protein
MIQNPIDISSRVSPELSSLIESIIIQLDSDEPVTLGIVRSFIEHEFPAEINETEQLHHFDSSESMVDELDLLIDEFGESAAAYDFVYAFASEPLSRIIDAIVNDANRENPATLATVKQNIAAGLPGSLVGNGVLDEDEDDTLLPEIDELIARFGDDALAENFLRYE